MKCLSCSGEVLPSHKYCPSCAAPVSAPSEMPTAAADAVQSGGRLPGSPALDMPVGRIISSDSIPVGGFTPGMILANRYRIIGLLGRGGMGEVYRADDLKLGQPVALKFLPGSLVEDPVRRERFYAEVRIARQVSHPNVCRVYDIAELDGRHFLSMEFIDGEDLASLLKRIGSLHGAKALDVARQLCWGLAAAHDKGVLHRDLKPANVMIDGRGRVRITDFGLAVAAGEGVPAGDASGTPAYMAPEQFAGQGASVRSDIYALGLVLYEMYTGMRAYQAGSLTELRSKKEGSAPNAPSEIARDIDAIVERVILRCMEKEPGRRPASVAQVAAALPGGDPLAAALAAGETPSPEMVAASGSHEGLRPWVAWTCLAFVVVGMAAAVYLGWQFSIFRRIPIERSPEALAERARQLLVAIGYSETPVDTYHGLGADNRYIQHVVTHDHSAVRFEKLPAWVVQFNYRQSPRFFEHSIGLSFNRPMDWENPPLKYSGECAVRLDGRGRLLELRVIPPQVDKASGPVQGPDWSVLFRESSLDASKWSSVSPEWSPPLYADARAAWQGTHPDLPEVSMRIEAAAYRGKPVAWALIGPWTTPDRTTQAGFLPEQRASVVVGLVCLMTAVGACLLARRNLKLGRGDRRGAGRLAVFLLFTMAISWALGEHHVPTPWETFAFVGVAAFGLLFAGSAWVFYVAIEPFVRRRWPGVLVSWSRLLDGRFRDPLVGRALLAGCVCGTVMALSDGLVIALPPILGHPQTAPFRADWQLASLSGIREYIPFVAGMVSSFVSMCLVYLFLFLLAQIVVRRRWAAAVLVALILGLQGLSLDPPMRAFIATSVWGGILMFALVRFGFLALAAAMVFIMLFVYCPITAHMSAWYFGIELTGLALLLGLAIYGFHTSLGGHPMFGRASLGD